MDTAEDQKKAVLAFRKGWKTAPRVPISKMQAYSARPRPVKGPLLVSNTTIPRPGSEEGENLRSKLWHLYQSKSEGVEKLDPPAPCSDYKAEWLGVRNDVKNHKAPQPEGTEQEKFNGIEQHATNDVTLFYVPGGAWFRAGSPGSRPLIQQLCQHSGSRAFTFQYRLVPQYTLPTLVLDTLVAYFYLIAPPPGSFHKPIDPKKIVLVGESGGGVLHLHLLQFLQSLLRGSDKPTITLNGCTIPIAMPRGCAFVSPAADYALALPSVEKFKPVDWLSEGAPWNQPGFPADEIWPASPPRGDLHCDDSARCHPLIDPSTWTDWEGMPPMWIACGEETFSDGVKFLVKNLKTSGVPVTFLEYEFMPHVWNQVIPALPQSKHCMKSWGEACRTIGSEAHEQTSSAWFVKLGRLEMVPRHIDALLDIPREEVLRRMRAARDELAKFVRKGGESKL
ncbi:alpha/beta-hydrolase [Aspergillus steynii IBT 23096]|uniref:Alpha/beta-hydrolase n=1 Tax=Aspergillus steynii IBT 23096 TaxID=1392250 RepID=A0A2I2GDM0_9EURO|nr:alpha/beta-hydrolase [Aspergillus steynii IBT 23096]PLB50907.1 alpha/beta-hydrolase [Aspergillus steynii IBT 23096]